MSYKHKTRPINRGRARLLFLMASALLYFSGCATTHFMARVDSPSGDAEKMVLVHEKAKTVSPEEAKFVRVYDIIKERDKLPAGIRFVSNDKGKLVLNYDKKKYVLRGYAKADRHIRHGNAIFFMNLWSPAFRKFRYIQFFPYDKTWRKYLCYPQVPLTWITIGFWSVVPIYWPCITSETAGGESLEDIKARKKHQTRALKKLAIAMGADTLLIEYARRTYTTINQQTGQVLGKREGPPAGLGVAFILDEIERKGPDEKYEKQAFYVPSTGKCGGKATKFNDTVILKNGVEIKGVSTALTSKNVILTYPNGKTVVLTKKEVDKIKKGN